MTRLSEHRSSNDVDVVRAPSTKEPEVLPTARPTGFEQVDRVDQTSSGIERRERVVLDRAGGEHRESITHDHGAERRLRLFKAEQVVWLILAVIDVLIGLRVILKLIAANPANGFAHFVYDFAGFFLGPFFGLTGTPSSAGMVLEVPSIIAMIVYALVAWGIVQVLRLIFLRGATQSISTYDHYQP